MTEGIMTSCWSPDQELLVLVTREHRVQLLSAEFLPIVELLLQQQCFGEAMPVDLGWGKKETQFHGTEGKQAAKVASTVEQGLAEHDDGSSAKISWRGDGQMFAINYVDRNTNTRKIKIVNREGILQSTSESVSKLEQPLSWKPSGSLVTSTQRLPNKYQVVFFEKNGLRHGEFTLPEKPNTRVKEVLWNMDSSVLLVWFHPNITNEIIPNGDDDEARVHCLQLWVVNNYTWYLKEELSIKNVTAVLWDDLRPLNLYVASSKCITTYTWTFSIDKSLGHCIQDLAIVSVINGKRLLMTPFRKSGIPPPMCAYEILFPEPISSIVYHSGSQNGAVDSNAVCVIHGSQLTLLASNSTYENLDKFNCKVDFKLGRSPHFKTTFPVHKIVEQYDLKEFDHDLFNESHHLSCVWLNDTTFYCVKSNLESDEQVILAIDFTNGKVGIKQIKTEYGPFLNLFCHDDKIYFQNNSGNVYEMTHGNVFLEPALDKDKYPITFLSSCSKLEVTSKEETVFIFGLSPRNRLYYENKQLSGNCSSFHIHDDHLLLTTTNHKLLMIPLNHNSLSSFASGNLSAAGERNIERGSKLVTALSNDCQVILQMPRGNLESIYPRPLLIHTLKGLLDKRQYHKVIELMRRHRVDMNLIHDHNPAAFFLHCEMFVQSVDNAGWIDLFIASLKNEDTTKTLYLYNYNSDINVENSSSACDEQSKVDKVCIAVRQAMVKLDEDKYLLPILSSFVKMDSTQMDEALRRVKALKDGKATNLAISAEEGLRHLLYIADANVLCDVALGTYDFDLVMMVFEKSQKDPKEFLPFLNNLKKMESQYMQYTINIYLKRYRKAFNCIKETNSSHVDECLTLIKKEKIFSVALEEFIPSTLLYRAVAEAYGDYNLGKGYYGEAAVLYDRAGKPQDALHAYQRKGNWRRTFIAASQLKYSKDQMLELYQSTVEILLEKKMFTDAAIIYKEYLNNEEEAVVCLTFAQHWDDAIRIAYQYNRLDLIDTNVIPALNEQCTSYENEIETIFTNFVSHCSRLLVVRENMEKEQSCLLDGTGDDHLDSDMYCDTSTVTGASHSRGSKSATGSNVSGRTYRSAKNRKKLERKKHSTKEGSSYEDLGLITELHSLIVRADAIAAPIGDVVSVLYSYEKDIQAIHLQSSLHSLLRLMESKEKIIWPADVDESAVDGPAMVGGAHMSTAEILRAKQSSVDVITATAHTRLRQLNPALRHAPKPTRPSDWALGFLHKKTQL